VRRGTAAEALPLLQEAIEQAERLLDLGGDEAPARARRAGTLVRLASGWGSRRGNDAETHAPEATRPSTPAQAGTAAPIPCRRCGEVAYSRMRGNDYTRGTQLVETTGCPPRGRERQVR
jgi:hypothetical protein